jgi:hypothetical protein
MQTRALRSFHVGGCSGNMITMDTITVITDNVNVAGRFYPELRGTSSLLIFYSLGRRGRYTLCRLSNRLVYPLSCAREQRATYYKA